MAPDRDELPAGLASLTPELLEQLRRGFPLHMDRQGQFSFEGDPVSHPGVVRLFRNNLDVTEAGEVTLGVDVGDGHGRKWVYLDLDDLPLRALRVDAPRGDERLPSLILDDGRRVALDPASLWEEPDAGLRCTVPSQVSGRPIAVRLSNTAAVDLSQWLIWPEGADRPELELDGQRWTVPERPPG